MASNHYHQLLVVLLAAPLMFLAHIGNTAAVVPDEGMYYKPDEPGTGFVLEYQAGVAVVTYFAYEDDGRPVWWQLSGELKEAAAMPDLTPPPPSFNEGSEIHFIEGDLQRFEGGSCLGCPFVKPEVAGSPSSVEIFFGSTTRARVFLGGETNNVEEFERLEFGFHQFISNVDPQEEPRIFQSASFPDLRGDWIFVTEAGVNGPWRFEFDSVEIEELEGSSNYRVTFGTSEEDVFLECVPVVDEEVLPGCELHSQGKVLFSARLGDIGAERIYGFRGRLGGELGSDDPGPLRGEHKLWGFRLIDRPVSD